MARQIKVIKVSDKVSYVVHPPRMGLVLVERAFKGNVCVRVLVEEALVERLTSSEESWKETVEEYDLGLSLNRLKR